MPKRISQTLHKYLGIPLCILLFLSALSGILLNHRDWLKTVNVPRAILPKEYRMENWSQGAVRSSLRTERGEYLYGTAGVWLWSGRAEEIPRDANEGIDEGSDNRKVLAMAKDTLDNVYLLTQYKLYRQLRDKSHWEEMALPTSVVGRFADLQLRGDSLVLLSRSNIYVRKLNSDEWRAYELQRADKHTEGELLFRLVWVLHSGEYFGEVGKLVVDVLGLIVILLSLTGLGYTIYRLRIKRVKRDDECKDEQRRLAHKLSYQLRLHNGFGRRLFYPLLFLFVTGWFLRPPLMLGLLKHRLTPWSISHIYSSNPWHERLRAIRYDKVKGSWLLYTSTGFYHLDSFVAEPKKWILQPYVSPMGINVFEQRADGEWLVGSFSGLNVVDGGAEIPVKDYFTGKSPEDKGNPFGAMPIAGMIVGKDRSRDVVFSYDEGLVGEKVVATISSTEEMCFPYQPAELSDEPFSLWQWALEVHTGRIYVPLLGKLGSQLFIFPFGLIAVVVLISGYRRLR